MVTNSVSFDNFRFYLPDASKNLRPPYMHSTLDPKQPNQIQSSKRVEHTNWHYDGLLHNTSSNGSSSTSTRWEFESKWLEIIRIDQKLLKMIWNNQKWSEMMKYDPEWSEMIRKKSIRTHQNWKWLIRTHQNSSDKKSSERSKNIQIRFD